MLTRPISGSTRAGQPIWKDCSFKDYMVRPREGFRISSGTRVCKMILSCMKVDLGISASWLIFRRERIRMMHIAKSRMRKAPILSCIWVRSSTLHRNIASHWKFLERKLGGPDIFLPYVRDYVSTYMGKSITTTQWKDHLYAYWTKHGGEEKVKILDSVDWDVSPLHRPHPFSFRFLTHFRDGFMVKD